MILFSVFVDGNSKTNRTRLSKLSLPGKHNTEQTRRQQRHPVHITGKHQKRTKKHRKKEKKRKLILTQLRKGEIRKDKEKSAASVSLK
jgi:hypothetical protein